MRVRGMCVSVYIYTYMYVCMHICIYMYIYMYIHTYTHTHTHRAPHTVFLAHGTELLSLFHLPFMSRSFASHPFKTHWLMYLLWPITLPALALLRFVGTTRYTLLYMSSYLSMCVFVVLYVFACYCYVRYYYTSICTTVLAYVCPQGAGWWRTRREAQTRLAQLDIQIPHF